jgi:hypothetical protein
VHLDIISNEQIHYVHDGLLYAYNIMELPRGDAKPAAEDCLLFFVFSISSARFPNAAMVVL